MAPLKKLDSTHASYKIRKLDLAVKIAPLGARLFWGAPYPVLHDDRHGATPLYRPKQ